MPNFNFEHEGKPINLDRYRSIAPSKLELINGHLFWSEEERLNMLGLLIENLGTDKVEEFLRQQKSPLDEQA